MNCTNREGCLHGSKGLLLLQATNQLPFGQRHQVVAKRYDLFDIRIPCHSLGLQPCHFALLTGHNAMQFALQCKDMVSLHFKVTTLCILSAPGSH